MSVSADGSSSYVVPKCSVPGSAPPVTTNDQLVLGALIVSWLGLDILSLELEYRLISASFGINCSRRNNDE